MKFIFASILLFVLICVCVKGEVNTTNEETTVEPVTLSPDEAVLERWKKFEARVKEGTNAAVKMLLPYIMDNAPKMNTSAQCMKEVMHLISGLKRIKPWAVRFLDSSAKIIDGMFVGTLSSFGIYDECLDTVVLSEKSKDKGKMLFQGQYCSIDFKLPVPAKTHFYKLNDIIPALQNFSKRGTVVSEASNYAQFMHFLSYRMAICVPSGCTQDDLNQVAVQLGDYIGLDTHVSRCEIKQELHFTPFQIGIIFIFCVPLFATLVATLIGVYAHYKKITFKSTGVRALMCFNFLTNFKKFLNTDSSSDTLSCLHGIRFITMTWVVLGHTYFIINYQLFIQMEKAKEFAADFAFQAIVNSSVTVDTFYCIGGLLVCYLTVKLVKIGKHPFNLPLYIIHRLFRIWPIYIYVILSLMLIDQMGSGPVWYENTNKYIEACYDNWWTNILFINNFYNAERMCIPQSWYIASDFQLYIGALIVLLPLLRWPKVGIAISLIIMVVSIVYTGIGTVIPRYPYAMLFAHPDPEQRIKYWADLYFKPFIHASPYCIGILAGYILATRPKLKIPPVIQVIGWCLAFTACFSVLYGVQDWNKGRDPGMVEGLFFACLSRSAWTLGVAWMIVCCATGHGGVVNYILSFKAFVPLGRLSFVVYLIHPIVQILVLACIKTLLQPEHIIGLYFFFGHLCLTYMIGFGCSMVLEAPVLALEKLVFSPPKKKSTEEKGRKNSSINGTLKLQKNGEMVVIVPEVEEPRGIDNEAVVYKL